MTLQDIIERVGEEEFLTACEEARQAAPTTGHGASGFNSDLPHDVSEWIWDSDLSPLDKLALVFGVYEQMPCYSFFFCVIVHAYRGLSEDERLVLWQYYARYLSSEDAALAEPAAYSLWCDVFESPARVQEAWNALVLNTNNERLLRRVLIASGPVPFALKEALYSRLLPDRKWHPFIFRSLLHSRHDMYGDFDAGRARDVFQKLDLPPDTEHLDDLAAILA